MGLPSTWEEAAYRLEHAFQPIARFSDGSVYGFEALLRGWEELGFSGIQEVFDRAYEERILYEFDLALRAKAFRRFARAGLGNAKLFYNLDTRLLEMPGYATGNTLRIAEDSGLPPSRIVFELSELFDPDQGTGFDRIVATYRNQGFRIALDDFGSGYAGLKLLHRAAPDIVKIDRYFVAGSDADPQKGAFLAKIAGLARLMGIRVVAEGVETADEGRVCREAGCDYIQGYLVARPSGDVSSLRAHYAAAHGLPEMEAGERRSAATSLVHPSRVLKPEPISQEAPLSVVLGRFRKEPQSSFIPVVDSNGEPVGAYRERDFREYVYSPFGISLLEHLEAEGKAASLLVKAPIASRGMELGRIVEAFGLAPDSGGVILTEGGRYSGMVDAADLLALVAERELVEARDQNPLSRLPGNHRIAETCAQRLADPGTGTVFAYFDFDNFKPFNDSYGFRNGDRVIMLFADILKSGLPQSSAFVGHLGGDDFFASIEEASLAKAVCRFRDIAGRFAREATSFYNLEDRERGWIVGKDRDGVERRIALLGVSVAVVHLVPGGRLDAEGLSELLAELKRQAKASVGHLAARTIGPDAGSRSAIQAAAGNSLPEASPLPAAWMGTAPGHESLAEIVFTPSLLAAF
jgi:EAL domain-containing protein (putative c-di-GMP-specific phosphodiesterase class I)/GGDEF domain-containing protein